MKKYVMYESLGTWYITTAENHNRYIEDARQIHNILGVILKKRKPLLITTGTALMMLRSSKNKRYVLGRRCFYGMDWGTQ